MSKSSRNEHNRRPSGQCVRVIKDVAAAPPHSHCHFRRCVTLAKATANACRAVNGYWKSSVKALLSTRPNCITCTHTSKSHQHAVNAAKLHHLHTHKQITPTCCQRGQIASPAHTQANHTNTLSNKAKLHHLHTHKQITPKCCQRGQIASPAHTQANHTNMLSTRPNCITCTHTSKSHQHAVNVAKLHHLHTHKQITPTCCQRGQIASPAHTQANHTNMLSTRPNCITCTHTSKSHQHAVNVAKLHHLHTHKQITPTHCPTRPNCITCTHTSKSHQNAVNVAKLHHLHTHKQITPTCCQRGQIASPAHTQANHTNMLSTWPNCITCTHTSKSHQHTVQQGQIASPAHTQANHTKMLSWRPNCITCTHTSKSHQHTVQQGQIASPAHTQANHTKMLSWRPNCITCTHTSKSHQHTVQQGQIASPAHTQANHTKMLSWRPNCITCTHTSKSHPHAVQQAKKVAIKFQ